MTNRIPISFLIGFALAFSSCSKLNYGTPYFASGDLQINADSLEGTSDFKRLFNKAYSDSAEFSAFSSLREKDSLEKTEFASPEMTPPEPIRKPVNSESNTVIYAETVNIYYGTRHKDSIAIIKPQEAVDGVDQISSASPIKNKATPNQANNKLSVTRKDSLAPTVKANPTVEVTDSLTPTVKSKKEFKVSDSTSTSPVKGKDGMEKSENTSTTIAQKEPEKSIVQVDQKNVIINKTDTIHRKVYMNDTVRSVVTMDPKKTKEKVEVSSPPKPAIVTKTDTVYQTKKITKVEKQNLPPTIVSDTVYIREIDTVFQSDVMSKLEKLKPNPSKVSDTVFIKEIDTIYQTKTDTVRIQEIKEVLSKPLIIEKKPRIELFTITFQKSTTKGDNLEELSAEILALCEKNKNYLIFLSAYTDKSGSESTNYAISQQRATSIRDQLIAKGIDKTKIVTQWFGEEFATRENSASERVVNVRIELSE